MLDELLKLSVPQFPHLRKKGIGSTPLNWGGLNLCKALPAEPGAQQASGVRSGCRIRAHCVFNSGPFLQSSESPGGQDSGSH
jgi:hypothetical protein